jgi:hypothetical protein
MASYYTPQPNRIGAASAPPNLSVPPPARTITHPGNPDASLGRPGEDSISRNGWRRASSLVAALITPPHKSDYVVNKPDHVVIDMAWVKSVLGEIHFIHDPSLGRSVLRQDSKIRVFGLQEGLPERYWKWLCGQNVEKVPWYANSRTLEMDKREFVRGEGCEGGCMR